MASAVRQRLRCRACLGTYQSLDAKGYEYYHACPPLSEAEWSRLPPPEQRRKKPGDERDHKRDENVAVDDQGRRTGIVRDGDGVDEL